MRLDVIATIALLTTLAPLAAAGHQTLEADGFILFGTPASSFTGGITEIAAACDPSSPLNGLDGVWYDITGFGLHRFTLTPDATLDADGYFYTAACALLSSGTAAEEFVGGVETGQVPATAAYIVVDGFAGAGAFTLTIA